MVKTEVASNDLLITLYPWRRLRSGDALRSVQHIGFPACHSASVIAPRTTVRITACSHPNPETMVERTGEWKARGGVKRPASLKECRSNARASAQAQRNSAFLGEHRPSDWCAVKATRRYFILGIRTSRASLENRGLWLLSSSLPGYSKQHKIMNIRIEFDGGTSCNIPRLGFGNGYGSYKINDEPIHRCNFNRPMSANAAEIFTLVYAINALRDRDLINISKVRLSIYGDSMIALNWAKRLFAGHSKPPKGKITGPFIEAVTALKYAVRGFENVHTQWRSRTFSVATFGH